MPTALHENELPVNDDAWVVVQSIVPPGLCAYWSSFVPADAESVISKNTAVCTRTVTKSDVQAPTISVFQVQNVPPLRNEDCPTIYVPSNTEPPVITACQWTGPVPAAQASHVTSQQQPVLATGTPPAPILGTPVAEIRMSLI